MNLNEVKKHVIFQCILYILIGICFLLSLFWILITPAKAVEQTTSINNDIHSSTLSTCGRGAATSYCATQTNQVGYARVINRQYNGVAECIDFEFDYNFLSNRDYILNIEAMDNDFRNNDLWFNYEAYTTYPSNATTYNSQGRFISNRKLQMVLPYNAQATHRVQICGSPLTGVSNYGLKNVYLTYDDGNQDLTGIIDNATANTTDIINNNNSNFESLKEQNESISVDSINSDRATLQRLCKNSITFSLAKGKRLDSNGSSITEVEDSNSFYTADYVYLPSGTTKVVIQNTDNSSDPYYIIFFNDNNSVVGYARATNSSRNVPSGATKFRVSSKYPGILITKNDECITNEGEINDFLQDDSDPTINNNGIDDAMSSVEISDPLNYLLTLPISLLQKLNTVLSANSCQRVSFGSLYDTELYLPCINFENILGSSIWGTIDLIVGVGLLAIILKRFYDSISNILTLGKEKEVRDKLDLPTPMQFMASILGGGRD